MSKQQKWHEKALLDILSTIDVQNGLSSQDVEKSRSSYGENTLDPGKKKNFLILFLEQFQDVMIIILIAAAIISAFLGEVCFR